MIFNTVEKSDTFDHTILVTEVILMMARLLTETCT